jgi:hypothetical protein
LEKLIICYEPDTPGLELVSDGDMEKYVEAFCKKANDECHSGDEDRMDLTIMHITSQELMVGYVRLMIRRGIIPHDQVVFWYKDYRLHPDKNARIREWPKGFCDHNDNILMELLDYMETEEQNVSKIQGSMWCSR